MNQRTLSAGILCYAVAEQTGDVYFLLGRERPSPNFHNSNRWSDFGGGVQTGESDIDAAAREFVEESMGVIQITPPCGVSQFQTVAAVKEMLQGGAYTWKVKLDVTRALEPTFAPVVVGHRVCYLKRIPWQPELPEKFDVLRDMFDRLAHFAEIDMPKAIQYYETLPKLVQRHPAIATVKDDKTGTILQVQVKDEYREKYQMGWWSLHRLYGIIRNNGIYRNKQSFRKGFLNSLAIIVQELLHPSALAPSGHT